MIDFHNHIIPNLDDGPESLESSLKMIEKAYHDGFTTIVNTVHLDHPTVKVSKEQILNYHILSKNLEKECIKMKLPITIISCAEVYFSEKTYDRCFMNNVLINNKYILIELNVGLLPVGLKRTLFNMQIKNITPIIAHPERYIYVQKNYKILNSLVQKGAIIQLNAKSFFSKNKLERNTVRNIIESGLFHLIGSDAHNHGNRNFHLKECYDFISANYGEKYTLKIIKNSENLIKGGQINSVICKKKTYWEKMKSAIR